MKSAENVQQKKNKKKTKKKTQRQFDIANCNENSNEKF